MGEKKFGYIINEERKRVHLTQKELADRLFVSKATVSKWERGLSIPSISVLLPLSKILGFDLNSVMDASNDKTGAESYSSIQAAHTVKEGTILPKNNRTAASTKTIKETEFVLHEDCLKPYSPLVFGQNLEHTRAAVSGGLSAQMLKNRKFAGKPQKNLGLAKDWFPIGERVFFDLTNNGYTHHATSLNMNRRNALQTQAITNLMENAVCGMGQGKLYLCGRVSYEVHVVTKTDMPVTLTVSLTDGDGTRILCQKTYPLVPGDWQVEEFLLTPEAFCEAGCLRITFKDHARIFIGAVSLMKCGHFHGMRPDVVDNLKKIGPRIIRWPGGNFAGEYRFRDGFLPVDERGPLQAYTEDETQPFSNGYDFHEINTDDFIALCREVGAEPFITINLAWDSSSDVADWVEYCNGNETTAMGKLRAERGHKEPYHVTFWSLGNEMGYGHMEGPNTAESYTLTARSHAIAMKQTDPSIRLFASGCYPNSYWAEHSANKLTDLVEFISLHYYSNHDLDFSTQTAVETTGTALIDQYKENLALIKMLRESLNNNLKISFDEWNVWYAWFRPSSVIEGIFAAIMLHMLINESNNYSVPICCYFQAINEGLITVTNDGSILTAAGQVFELMKAHQDGLTIHTDIKNNGTEIDPEAVFTCHGNEVVLTVVNRSITEKRSYIFTRSASAVSEHLLLSSEDICPYSQFTESELTYIKNGDTYHFTLPPHSVARMRLISFSSDN